MMVFRLSALRIGRLYPPRKYSWYSFLLQADSISGPQCGRKYYVNDSNDAIGNRTRDLPACSAVPRPTALSRAPQRAQATAIFSPGLTLNLLTTTIVAPPSNASKWQMGLNSAFKGLIQNRAIKMYGRITV